MRQLRFWSCRRNHEIYLLSYEDNDVGYVSFVHREGSAYVTIVVLPGYRGKGLGKLAIDYLKQFYNPIVAEIFASNLRSIALFEKCGFHFSGAGGDKVVLRFPVFPN